jgi:hypothetical protein
MKYITSLKETAFGETLNSSFLKSHKTNVTVAQANKL